MRMRSCLSSVVLAVASVSLTPVAQAIDLNWDANDVAAPVKADGSGTWDLTTLNWYNGGLGTNVSWTNGSNAIFGANQAVKSTATPYDISVGAAIVVQDITINGGSSTGAVGTVYSINDDAGGQLTLNGNIIKGAIGGNSVIGLANNGLAIGSGMHTLTIHDSDGDDLPEVRITSVISGDGGFIMDNSAGGTSGYDSYGSVSFNRANTYTGQTIITDGRLGIVRNTGLGSTSAGTTIGALGTLAIGGGNQLPPLDGLGNVTNLNIAEPITITRNTYTGAGAGTGSDAANYGAAIITYNGTGNTTFSGPFVIDTTDARLRAQTSTLTVSSDVTAGPSGATPSISITGDTAGYVHLTGNNSALVGGVNLINAELIVDADSQIGSGTTPLTFNGGTYRPAGGYATDFGAHAINASTFNGGIDVDDGKVFNINQALGSSTVATGSIGKRGTGTLNFTSVVNLRGGASFWDAGAVNVNSAVTLSGLRLRSPVVTVGTGGVLSTVSAYDSLGADSAGTAGGPDKAKVYLTGNGQFIQTDGNDFNISDNANTEGTIYIQDTATLTTGGITSIGRNAGATGTIVQTGGTFNQNRNGNFGLVLGNRNGTGNYTMSGGTLNAAGEFYVGQGNGTASFGTGTFAQTGGTVNLTNWFVVGREGAGGTATLTGTITAPGVSTTTFNKTGGGNVQIDAGSQHGGDATPSVLTVDGAVFNDNNEFQVATDTGAVGTVNVVNGGIINVGNWLAVGRAGSTGTLNILSGSVNKSGGNQSYVGENAAQNSAINVSGGALNITTGELWAGNAGSSKGTINLSGSGVIIVNSWLALGRNGTATGILNMTGGTLTKTGGGEFVIGSGGGATGFLNQSAGTITSNFTRVGESGTGTATLTGGTANFGTLFVGNNGPSGTLSISGTAAVTAGATVLGNAGTTLSTVNLTGGSFNATSIAPGASTSTRIFNFAGGTLSTGAYTIAGGLVNTGTGTFAPGGVGVAGTSALTTGYTQGATAAMTVDIASAASDSVTSTAAVTLSGTLNLNRVAAYIPARYVPVSILSTTGALTGIYSKINGVVIDANHSLAVTYTATGVNVTAALPGDATVDGTVNFDDLVPLAQNYNGAGKTWSQGDFDGTGNVNFDDLVILAQHYNTNNAGTPQLQGLSAAFQQDWALAQSLVPEPTSLALLGLGAAAMIRRRK